MTDEPAKDWLEEGKKHFLSAQQHPERPCHNYPTRDRYTAEDEALFINGFNLAKAEWEKGGGLSGTEAYAIEREEIKEDGTRTVIIKEVEKP